MDAKGARYKLLILTVFFVGSCNLILANQCDKIGLWTTCGYRNSTQKECEKQSCCYVSDTFKKDRNLTQNCAKPPPSFVWKNGTCSKYKGATCVPFIGNKTLEQDIFFDTRYGINGTEKILVQFINLAKSSLKGTTICVKKIIPAAICHTMMPTCNSKGRPVLSCKEDCDEIFRMCGESINRFYGALELYIKLQSIDFSHLNVPVCSDLKYSYEYDKAKNESCQFIGLFDHSKRNTNGKTTDVKKIAIIVACCGAVLLISIIALAWYIRRRRKIKLEEKEKEAAKDLELFSSFTTVRDRIRQDSSPNPLIAALAQLKPEEKPPQCRLDRVEYVKDLGQGQFGKVFQGCFKLSEEQNQVSVAVKMLKEGSSAETKDAFIQEVTLMSVLHHENILKLIAVSTEEEPFCMVFDFMPNGDLNQFLRKNDPENATTVEKVALPFGVLVNFARQIACGMEYLSKKKFVHRDLATRNCLVSEDLTVKIADFGMSRDIYESEYYKVGGAAMLPIRWMPPEALLYGKFTVESDVYSYGVLLWEIFTYALQPFYGYSNDEVVKFIKKGAVLPRPDICSQVVYDNIMTKCWIQEPEKRLTFTEIIRRFDGDYQFCEERFIPKKKKKEIPQDQNYSVPPPAMPVNDKENRGRTISRGKDGSIHDYQNFQPNADDTGENHLEVIEQNGAMNNPSFRISDAPEDLYDRPKSHLNSFDESSTEESRPDTSLNPIKSIGSGDGYLYSVPKATDDDDDSIDEQLYDNIKKKRYVSSDDVLRLSKKSSQSDSSTLKSDRSDILLHQ